MPEWAGQGELEGSVRNPGNELYFEFGHRRRYKNADRMKERGVGAWTFPGVAGPRTPPSPWLTVSSGWRGTVGGTRAKEALKQEF